MNTPSFSTEEKPLQIRRGRVESVDLYEVKDSELDLLEKGSPATIQLNFSVFLLSIAFSSVAALCTATFKWDIAEMIFVFVSVIGLLMGVYLLIIWWRTRESIGKTVKCIRSRIEQPLAEDRDKTPIRRTLSKPLRENEPSG